MCSHAIYREALWHSAKLVRTYFDLSLVCRPCYQLSHPFLQDFSTWTFQRYPEGLLLMQTMDLSLLAAILLPSHGIQMTQYICQPDGRDLLNGILSVSASHRRSCRRLYQGSTQAPRLCMKMKTTMWTEKMVWSSRPLAPQNLEVVFQRTLKLALKNVLWKNTVGLSLSRSKSCSILWRWTVFLFK